MTERNDINILAAQILHSCLEYNMEVKRLKNNQLALLFFDDQNDIAIIYKFDRTILKSLIQKIKLINEGNKTS